MWDTSDFCLTVLQHPDGKAAAARRYSIALKVLTTVGRLSTEKGGQQARKAVGKDTDLTDQERHFLEEAVKAIIRRVAETAYNPDGIRPGISLGSLPSVKT